MYKNLVTFFVIIISALLLLIFDFQNILRVADNEGIQIDNIDLILQENDYYSFKNDENNFWSFLKNGDDDFAIAQSNNNDEFSFTNISEQNVLGKSTLTVPDTNSQFNPTPTLNPVNISETIPIDTPIITFTPSPTPTPIELESKSVMIVGDSMAAGALGIDIERNLIESGDFEVQRFGKSSTGLNRVDYFDWYNFTAIKLDEISPDIVIVIFGANDGQRIYDFDESRYYNLLTDGWRSEYSHRVDMYANFLMAKKVEKVFWIGLPNTNNPDFKHKFDVMNSIYDQALRNYQDVHYVGTWDLFMQGGKYSDFIADETGKKANVKTNDGVHLTYHGAGIITNRVLSIMDYELEFK